VWADAGWVPVHAADGHVFALKQVKLKGMKRVDREEAIDEVTQHAQCSACKHKAAAAACRVLEAKAVVTANIRRQTEGINVQHQFEPLCCCLQARVLSQLSHPHITQHHGSFIGAGAYHHYCSSAGCRTHVAAVTCAVGAVDSSWGDSTFELRQCRKPHLLFHAPTYAAADGCTGRPSLNM
jgi:hypothetical protein